MFFILSFYLWGRQRAAVFDIWVRQGIWILSLRRNWSVAILKVVDRLDEVGCNLIRIPRLCDLSKLFPVGKVRCHGIPDVRVLGQRGASSCLLDYFTNNIAKIAYPNFHDINYGPH